MDLGPAIVDLVADIWDAFADFRASVGGLSTVGFVSVLLSIAGLVLSRVWTAKPSQKIRSAP